MTAWSVKKRGGEAVGVFSFHHALYLSSDLFFNYTEFLDFMFLFLQFLCDSSSTGKSRVSD